jgi:hypothetical protein
MRRLLFATSSLSVLFMLLILIPVWIGRGQPAPLLVEQLHLRDCAAPCWIGITPGQTNAEAVNLRLMDTFQSENSELSSSVPQYQWYTIVPLTQPPTDEAEMPIEFSVSDGVIEEVLIPAFFGSNTPDVTLPTLGDVVNVLGEPACVDPNPSTFSGLSLLYVYENTLAEIGVQGDDLIRWSQPIFYLSIRRDDLAFRVNGCEYLSAPLPPWTGLTRWPHYMRRALELS